MHVFEAAELLALWERGAARHALDRSALLCAFARPDVPAGAIADLPLGEVTASLLRLYEASFGPRIRAHVDCGRCRQRLELPLSTHELLRQDPGAGATEAEVAGLRVRAPSLRDLAAVAGEPDAGRAVRALLARCTLQGSGADLGPGALEEVEAALEDLDPHADLAFEVHCQACGHEGTAQLDAGALLWDEVEARARALLAEVAALARAFGWTENEVLALGPARRGAYLALAGGA